MSTIIHENDQFKVNVFYGGDERGPCLQITMQECRDQTLLGAAQVDLAGAIQLYNTLGGWIKGECERRQKLLRDGTKAFVRHHETEHPTEIDETLLRYLADGASDSIGDESRLDIIGMYPETRVINEFEVPAPETEELEYGASYYKASLEGRHFHTRETWGDHDVGKLWLERGLVFLCAKDAVANAKAMLGIDPHEGDES